MCKCRCLAGSTRKAQNKHNSTGNFRLVALTENR